MTATRKSARQTAKVRMGERPIRGYSFEQTYDRSPCLRLKQLVCALDTSWVAIGMRIAGDQEGAYPPKQGVVAPRFLDGACVYELIWIT